MSKLDHSGILIPLKIMQGEACAWVLKNFGHRPAYHPLLGAVEELGELAHAHLKGEQGIREGAIKGKAEAMAKDAVADTVLFLMDYCSANGWDFGVILKTTWEHVREREWGVPR